MSERREARRGAVKCLNCGTIRVAEILSNESFRILGSKEACACRNSKLRLLR